ncbi:cytochrome c biogenesis protein ResB [Ornithinimicrobium sp. Arc0846-15]|nr:cytochrome c biogenesis protein ResB [Ornithinimicrobium laminariae]
MSKKAQGGDKQAAQPSLGIVGWARWIWRQLTSMRVALMLLLLLAVAAIPGSVWPQRPVSPELVRNYLRENPTLGPWLDRLGIFDVYASPWFAAIYLLLMISLVGCLIPRIKVHFGSLKEQPPKAPKRLDRLAAHHEVVVAAPREDVLAAARSVLKRRGYRLRAEEPDADGVVRDVASEGGFLKETGNIVFHFSLLGIIVAVAVGHLFGWRGEAIIVEGQRFTSSVGAYDTLQPGPWADVDGSGNWTLTLDDLDVEFETEATGVQFGAPRLFDAQVSIASSPDDVPTQKSLSVNDPVSLDGASVYLLGNGYAPIITVRDAEGNVTYSDAVPFLTQDDNYTSTGAVKVSGADPELGLYGAFLPTVEIDPEFGPTSTFPGLVDPALALGVYQGELFPAGEPQSVYALDISGMDPVQDGDGNQVQFLMSPGEQVDLPDELGSIAFEGVARWGGVVARHDPGRIWVLAFAITTMLGLIAMLSIRRRRIYVRLAPEDETDQAHTGMTVAGLVKGTDPTLTEFTERIAAEIADKAGAPLAQKDN